MKDLSEALNGRGKTVDRLQIHLQDLLLKLQETLLYHNNDMVLINLFILFLFLFLMRLYLFLFIVL